MPSIIQNKKIKSGTVNNNTKVPALVKSPNKVVNKEIDITKATQITRANVKYFYKKQGFIEVRNNEGEVLHRGHTRNMGKIFSNYVNCKNYNQSYDFNLEDGDVLYFEEARLD